MKISRFIQFLCLCALLFGSTSYAGSLSRAITKVAPTFTAGDEEAAEVTVAAAVAVAKQDRVDRIVSTTAAAATSGSGTSSRRQVGTVQANTRTTAAAAPTVSAPTPNKPSAPESFAHKPAVATSVPGKIIHPTYPPKSLTSAPAPLATSETSAAATSSEPTLAAPKSEMTVVTPKLTSPIASSSPTGEATLAEKTPLHNALRDADAPQEHSLRGPGSSVPPALLAPTSGPTSSMRGPSEPRVVRPIELESKSVAAAQPRIAAEATPNLAAPKSLSSGVGTSRQGMSSQGNGGLSSVTNPSLGSSTPSAAAKPMQSTPMATKETEPREARPQAVASDIGRPRTAPLLSSDPSQPGALNSFRGEEDDSGEKSVIGKTPADAQSRQLFESQEEVPLTPELVQLKKRTQAALAHYYQNWTLNTRDHSPWEVMHAIVAYGVDTRLRKGGPGGESMTAIGHLCFSGVSKNQPILTMRKGELYALRGPGVQGHSGQFLAILAQSYLQRDYPLYVGGKQFTLEDLIEAEKKDCEAGTELTFKLISLMHYLPSDSTWTNFQGQEWSLDRLVREEIVQPVRGAACGGTHRLMGLSYAVRKREQRGEPITGIYLEAEKYIDQYHKYTWSLQNPDGSFSTAWFVKKEARNDIDRRMQTTGHVLEWLAFSLTDEQLRDPRMIKAVRYITDTLLSESVSEWEIGHLGHALHALQIYNERVFGGPLRSFEGLVSRRPLKTAQRPTQGAKVRVPEVRSKTHEPPFAPEPALPANERPRRW